MQGIYVCSQLCESCYLTFLFFNIHSIFINPSGHQPHCTWEYMFIIHEKHNVIFLTILMTPSNFFIGILDNFIRLCVYLDHLFYNSRELWIIPHPTTMTTSNSHEYIRLKLFVHVVRHSNRMLLIPITSKFLIWK